MPRWSPLGVKFKIYDEHPRLFHKGGSPPPLGKRCWVLNHNFKVAFNLNQSTASNYVLQVSLILLEFMMIRFQWSEKQGLWKGDSFISFTWLCYTLDKISKHQAERYLAIVFLRIISQWNWKPSYDTCIVVIIIIIAHMPPTHVDWV